MRKTIVLGLCLAVFLAGVTFVAVGCGGNGSSVSDSGSVSELSAVTQSCRANQRTVQGACQVYYAENMKWPASLATLAPTYVRQSSLQCPAGGSYTLRIANDQPVVTCPNGHTL